MKLLKHPLFLSLALSHFIVDVLNGQVTIVLAVLSVPLGLSYAALGLISTIYSLVGALGQPVFGWLSDRWGTRWAAAGGVLWMAFFFALAAVTPEAWAIVLLVIGALGSAAFHPPGTMKAAQVGHLHMTGQAATAASLFFLFGQGGLSVGPGIGGWMIDHLGRLGLLLLAALTVPVGLWTARELRPALPAAPGRGPTRAAPAMDAGLSTDRVLFMLVMLLAGLRTWAQSITITFAPKYFQDQGVSPTIFGVIVAIFMGSSAIGGVLGAMLADRWGRRRTVTLALALSILPFYFFPVADGAGIFVLAALAGLFNGAPHSVFITLAQRALPGRAAFASGLTLGLMFAFGAVGAYLGGLVGDVTGLQAVLQGSALIAVVTTVLSLALRPERKVAASFAATD
jgi:FSR family fosmidomycin resistance protein-like MFS transporter